MHRVLQTPYLLNEIFECYGDKDKPELYRAALICRIFSDSAQAILWRNVDHDLIPLINLLTNIRSIQQSTQYGGRRVFWSLDGPITPKDVERLIHFGKRVRKVTTFIHYFKFFKPPQRVASDVYTAIISALDGEPLLPNLQSLDLLGSPDEESKSCIVPLLISTRLSYISFLTCSYPPVPPYTANATQINDASRLIIDSASVPNLYTVKSDIPATPSSIKTVLTLKNLRVLQLNIINIPYITLSFLYGISSLIEGLKELTLQGVTFKSSTAQKQYPPICFSSLNSLDMTCTLDDMADILESLELLSLRAFNLDFIIPTGTPRTHIFHWEKLFTALYNATTGHVKNISLKPCEGLPFCGPNWYKRFKETYPGVSFSTIADSVFQFKLTDFVLDFPICNTISSEDIKSIIETWPDLKSFGLRCASKTTVDHSILKMIARKLPKLKHLYFDVCVSYRVAKPPRRLLDHPLDHMALRTFGLHTRDPEFVASVALFIDSLFPSLSFYMDGDDVDAEEVRAVLEHLQKARKIERRRLGVATDGEPASGGDNSDVE